MHFEFVKTEVYHETFHTQKKKKQLGAQFSEVHLKAPQQSGFSPQHELPHPNCLSVRASERASELCQPVTEKTKNLTEQHVLKYFRVRVCFDGCWLDLTALVGKFVPNTSSKSVSVSFTFWTHRLSCFVNLFVCVQVCPPKLWVPKTKSSLMFSAFLHGVITAMRLLACETFQQKQTVFFFLCFQATSLSKLVCLQIVKLDLFCLSC